MTKHEATPESRQQVKLMAAYGTVPECIARVVGVSVTELMKTYKDEIETAEIEAVAKVAEGLFKRAVDGDNVAAIFIMETRGGWSRGAKK
jgi:hypothetical protein